MVGSALRLASLVPRHLAFVTLDTIGLWWCTSMPAAVFVAVPGEAVSQRRAHVLGHEPPYSCIYSLVGLLSSLRLRLCLLARSLARWLARCKLSTRHARSLVGRRARRSMGSGPGFWCISGASAMGSGVW